MVVASPRRNWPAVTGLLLGLAGVVGYFLVVFFLAARLPAVRNWARPNWLLVGAGLTLSTVGVWRTVSRRGEFQYRLRAVGLAIANGALAGAFAWLLYGMSAVPPASGPAVGVPAPDFTMTDQDGRTVRLADFRGAPLLLVFYRGHW